jgi:glutathione S-transferase
LIEDIADTQLDAALYAIAVVEMGSGEQVPEMHAAVARDLERIYSDLENALDADFFCGAYSLADIAVLPHLVAASFLGFVLDPQTRRVDGLGTDPACCGA